MEILLRDLEAGQQYILQVRAKGSNGSTSSWSTAYNLLTTNDTVAPKPVTGLTWDAVGTSFVAKWNKPLEDANGKPLKDLRDYKVSLTAASQTVVYFVTQEKFDFTLEANRNSFGTPQATVEISVQARDRSGNLSTSVTLSESNPVPADVTGFSAEGISSAIALIWDSSTDDDIKYYEVYMSTTGSGFIPDSSNIVYTGAATSFTYPTTNFVAHYFKIRAVDVFNQGSVNYASDSATPESSTGIDLTPPDAPTDVAVTSNSETDGYATLEVTWTASASSNLSDYVVRYSVDEVAWVYVTVPGDQEEAVINGVLPNINYYVQVSSMSYANTKSSWVLAATYPITTASDTSAPSKPSEPIVSISTQMAQISHDMTKDAGGDLESDVIYLEVHSDVSSGFTPSNSTLRGTIDSAGPGIDVSGVFYVPIADSTATYFWKVIAVDRAKNKSIASDATAGLPGLIENANIANATITSAKIQSLEANKITAGTGVINDLEIKSELTIGPAGHIRSDNYDAGLETGFSLDEDELIIFDGSIFASSLLLQDSQNIIPPAFADFEFNDEYYHAGNIPNSIVMSCTSGLLVEKKDDHVFGNNSLRIFNTVITNPTTHNLIFAPGGLTTSDCNVDVAPGTYIFSGYFKKNGSVNGSIKFNFYTDTGVSISSSNIAVSSTSWIRQQASLVVPSGVSKIKAYITVGPDAANTGYDILVDGLQIERQMTALTAAGLWKPPSSTSIDGGSIVTGSIRSNAASSTVPDQPAWSINTAGNMQIGDALVRGSLTVGLAQPHINIMPEEFSDFELASSYYHDASNIPNQGNVWLSSFSTQRAQIISDCVFGVQALRLWDDSAATDVDRGIFFTKVPVNPAGNNIFNIIPGKTYIVSAYIKNRNLAKNTLINYAVYQGSGSFFFLGTDINITSYSTYTRVYYEWTAAAGFDSAQFVIYVTPTSGSTGFDISVDGIMFEEKLPGQTTPSDWTSDIGEESFMSSGNYIAGLYGWKLFNDGSAELNNGTFRGSLEISTAFQDKEYSAELLNRGSVWKTSTGKTLGGISPTIHFKGTGFRYDTGSLSYVPTDPFQTIFRMAPEAGFQIMFDNSQEERVFYTDANNDYDINFNRIDDMYGYVDFRGGTGKDPDAGDLSVEDNNTYNAHIKAKAVTPTPFYSSSLGGVRSVANASTLTYQFLPATDTWLTAQSEYNSPASGANVIPDPWDIFDGVLATYSSNSVRNRITLGSVATGLTPWVGAITSAAQNALITTVTSAGAGTPSITFAATTTTYNVTVEPGAEYSMAIGLGYSAAAGTLGLSIRYFMKLSNGTVLYSISRPLDGFGNVDNPNFRFTTLHGMEYADVFHIPAGITTANVGFEILGTVSTNVTLSLVGGRLMKTRDGAGNYLAGYNSQLIFGREGQQTAGGTTGERSSSGLAYVRVRSSATHNDYIKYPHSNTIHTSSYSLIELNAQNRDFIAGTLKGHTMAISSDGVRWGGDSEFRPNAGIHWRNTSALDTVAVATTKVIPLVGNRADGVTPTTAPTIGGGTMSDGGVMQFTFTGGGTNTENPTSGANPGWKFICRRAGFYLVHFSIDTNQGGSAVDVNQYIEIMAQDNNGTGTVTRYAVNGWAAVSYETTVSAIVPASAGDRIFCRYRSGTAGTRTIAGYNILIAQII